MVGARAAVTAAAPAGIDFAVAVAATFAGFRSRLRGFLTDGSRGGVVVIFSGDEDAPREQAVSWLSAVLRSPPFPVAAVVSIVGGGCRGGDFRRGWGVGAEAEAEAAEPPPCCGGRCHR